MWPSSHAPIDRASDAKILVKSLMTDDKGANFAQGSRCIEPLIPSYFVHLMARRVCSALYERSCSHTCPTFLSSPISSFVRTLYPLQFADLTTFAFFVLPCCFTAIVAATLPLISPLRVYRVIRNSWAQRLLSLALLERPLSHHFHQS